MDALTARTEETLAETGDEFPYVVDADTGRWMTTSDGNWCGGHWVDLLWLARDHAARDGTDLNVDPPRFADAARTHAETLRAEMPRDNMFCGMNFHYAGFRGYDTTGDRSFFALGLEGADAMVAAFHERARMVPIGEYQIEGPEEQFDLETEHADRPPGSRVGATDAVYTALPVLWRAYRETSIPEFRDVAVAHADRHLDWCLRPDGSTWHECAFDPETGALERQFNDLAHGADTCWSRGQGWSIAGVARAYSETGAERYLAALERMVDYYTDHTPSDMVPYWDFEDPEIPDAPRDSSAAALVAYGLTRLRDEGDDPERVAALRDVGHATLDSLLRNYLVTDPDDDRYGAVLHGCFDRPGDYAVDTELLWTNYYLARTVHDALRDSTPLG